MITAAQCSEAATILQEGAVARSQIPASTVNHMQIMAEEVYIGRWIIGGLLAEIVEFLLSHIGPFQDALDQLAGQPGEIIDHADSVRAAGQAVSGAVVQTVAQGQQIATGQWQGQAVTEFIALVQALIRVLQTYRTVTDTVADGEIATAERVGAVREYITDLCGDMLGEVVNYAIEAALWSVPTLGWSVLNFFRWAVGFFQGYLDNVVQVLQQLATDCTSVMGQVAGLGLCLERAAIVLEGGADPGMPGGLDPSGPAAQYAGTEPHPEDMNLAELASGVESDPALDTTTQVGDYQRLTPAEAAALGIDPALLRDDENGFAAAIYYNPETGQYVVTMAGTDFGTAEDVGEDAIGGVTVSPQTQNAIALAQAINASPELADNVVYTGHSLGGRLAAIASMTSGNPAVTFNAAGVSPATVAYVAGVNGMTSDQMSAQLDAGQVRSYSTADDPLTNLQERGPTADMLPDAVGARIYLGGDNLNPITGHLMPNVREQMEAANPGFYNP